MEQDDTCILPTEAILEMLYGRLDSFPSFSSKEEIAKLANLSLDVEVVYLGDGLFEVTYPQET